MSKLQTLKYSFQSQIMDLGLQISIIIIWILRSLMNIRYGIQKQGTWSILTLTRLCI